MNRTQTLKLAVAWLLAVFLSAVTHSLVAQEPVSTSESFTFYVGSKRSDESKDVAPLPAAAPEVDLRVIVISADRENATELFKAKGSQLLRLLKTSLPLDEEPISKRISESITAEWYRPVRSPLVSPLIWHLTTVG